MWELAIVATLTASAAVGIGGYFRLSRSSRNGPSVSDTSIAVLPFVDLSPAKD
jgi:hypothetical protein